MLPDFSNPFMFMLLMIILFIIISGRYFLVAGMFYAVCYLWFPEKYRHRKLSDRAYSKNQFKKEIKYSLLSSVIFTFTGAIALLLWQYNLTKVYIDFHSYPLWYLPLSLLIYMLLQETYYYWSHRWMHIPKVFRIVHKVHHDSKIASPFTAFSFHPLEALIQAVFLPILILFIPIHLYILIFLLVIMSLSSVMNHLDIELYPARWKNNVSKWIIGATHHSLHHKYYKFNFGLYFTFWDRLKKTENKKFEEYYKKATGIPAQQS